jgi:hypothetical protein
LKVALCDQFLGIKIKTLFKDFYSRYPYIIFDDIIDYFSVFGGLGVYLELFNGIDCAIKDIIKTDEVYSNLPFFILNDPFKKFLIKLAQGDGRLYSIFNKIGVGYSLGSDIVEELLNNDIIYIVNSRENPLKVYKKQLIKKELRNYTIEPKIYFKKPFFRFWFMFVEPYRDKQNKININKVLDNFNKNSYRLSSLAFEQLSIELLKDEFKNIDTLVEIASYWDRFSEFDIYSKTKSNKYILGECKYKNRPITKAELLKLKAKANNSNLKVDKFALFSKSGFSHELYKLDDKDLLLYELLDFKRLLQKS